VHAVQERSVWRSLLCGLFAGLAYLTRPEGALILPAFGAVLIALQLRSDWRCSWPRFFACGASAAATAALVGALYVGATGKLTNKPSPRIIMDPSLSADRSAGCGPQLFAAAVTNTDRRGLLCARSAWAIVTEINQGYHYLASIPMLLG